MSAWIEGGAVIRANDTGAFSLVESIVAIVAVVTVATTVFLVWGGARDKARTHRCVSILQRYGQAFATYVADFQDLLPYENIGAEDRGHLAWYYALAPYMGPDDRHCPAVDQTQPNFQDGYRMNSKLGRPKAVPPRPYRKLNALPEPGKTVVLFDGFFGGKKLSFKGDLADVDYRHDGAVNILFADWSIRRLNEKEFRRQSEWLPPQLIWNPDADTQPESGEPN